MAAVLGMDRPLPPRFARHLPALRYGSGRSSFEKPNRWLFVACGNHSSPPQGGGIIPRFILATPGLHRLAIVILRQAQDEGTWEDGRSSDTLI
ncbi:hypothetical protein C7I85_11730 [Mesorhizobium soli]|uniref:Uncharacterized protein n=1 Tax=Pseudaminobacter soli (ex Li et al. 2025) TaxID=1295366 RepID=A0A2P7SDY7_9HYPH|nr:hypothetical protein C7I85_11730 [Mesorhizobium soli]